MDGATRREVEDLLLESRCSWFAQLLHELSLLPNCTVAGAGAAEASRQVVNQPLVGDRNQPQQASPPPTRRAGRRDAPRAATASTAACGCPSWPDRADASPRLAAPAGWYPGDWVWLSLLTLLSHHGRRGGRDRARMEPAPTHPSSWARSDSSCARRTCASAPRSTATRPRAGAGEAERPHRMAGECERLDQRPRLVPKARHAKPACRRPRARPRRILRQVEQDVGGFQPATWVFRRLPAVSTPRKCQDADAAVARSARQASAARIRARSPADRECAERPPPGKRLVEVTRLSFTKLKTFVTASGGIVRVAYSTGHRTVFPSETSNRPCQGLKCERRKWTNGS